MGLKKISMMFMLVCLSSMICTGQQDIAVQTDFKNHLSKDQLLRIAECIRITETDPLNERSDTLRKSLLLWIIESPDISVTIFNILPVENDYKYKSLFVLQPMITSARVIIENPRIKKNQYQIQLKTLETLLTIYEKLLSDKGETARSKSIDLIVMKRDDGTLKQYVKNIIKKNRK
jgi:hypothetical protein